jgi:hypothetical protein
MPTAAPPELIPRKVGAVLLAALEQSRAVGLLGPRQVGKTTLVRTLLRERFPADYVTLDDEATRSAALGDPTGFVAGLPTPTIIDEVQRVPALMLALKQRLDQDRGRGQFLITGSANVMTMPSIRDALPGRIEYVRLWPLAASEIQGGAGDLVDRLFAGEPPRLSGQEVGRPRHSPRLVAGGFPDARLRSTRWRNSFFEGYVDSIVGREVLEIARLRDAGAVGRLLRVVAARSATLLNTNALGGALGADRKTIERHLELLEELLIVRFHAAWRKGLSGREIRSPKVYVVDTGLMAALVGADAQRIDRDDDLAGRMFETFAAMEVVKLAGWSDAAPKLMHYRDRDLREVDVVLERANGDIVGIEVKAAATVRDRDMRGLRHLRDRHPEEFMAGVVLYTGAATVPFGDRLWALPMSALWS